MKLKVYSISILSLLSLCIGGITFAGLSNDQVEEVEAYSVSSLPTTIYLNDNTEQEIRSYYSGLNSLSKEERSGSNLLKNLKPILKNGQKYYSYDTDNSGRKIWQIYEISDRDWKKSPASSITYGTYNKSTNTITGYQYSTNSSIKDNPYVHALYINRDVENQSRAWGNHEQDEWGINREHVWPKSQGFNADGSAGVRGDPMHLMAGNGYSNNKHNDHHYGYVDKTKKYVDCGSTYTNQKGNLLGYSKTTGDTNVFEPQDCDKGDIARAIFYLVARYNYISGSDSDGISQDNPNLELVNYSAEKSAYTSSTTETGKMGILQDLLEWNRLDPPDEFEIHRNNLLYRNFTNNRNPFIDFPEWAEYIWGKSTNGTYNSTVTGTADPTNDLINKFGNGATAGPNVTISQSSANITVGGTVTLTAQASDSSAISWSTSDSSVATVVNGVVTGVKAGSATITASATIGGNTYSKTCLVTVSAPAVVNTGDAKLYSGNIEEGDYVIYYSGRAMKNTVTNNRLDYSEVTPANNTISNPDESIVWHIVPKGDYWSIYNSAVSKYAASTGAANKAQLLNNNNDDKALWSVTGSSGYTFENKYNKDNSVNSLLRNNTTYGFACYSNSTGGALSLYKIGEDELTLSSISITGQTTTFTKGDTFAFGGTVTATYSDGSTKNVTGSASFSGYNMQTAGAQTVTVSYTEDGVTKTTTYQITVEEPQVTLSNIVLTTNDVKTEYKTSETFSSDGLIVTAKYSDGSTKDVTTSVTINGYDLSQTGVQTITVSYTEDGVTETATYQIMVSDPQVVIELTDIAVTTQPTKTEYYTGDELDTTGMVVTATYSDGNSMEVSGYTLSSVDMSTTGEKTITITYQEHTTEFVIIVSEAPVTLSSIAIIVQPAKVEYEVGDTFSTDGIAVTATYSDGSTKDVTSSIICSGYDMRVAGTQTVTVSYTENGFTKTATYQITVNEPTPVVTLSSIAITTQPTKTEYVTGEELDTTGMVVTATYSDDSTAVITDYTVSGYDKTVVGTQTVTVTYQGKTATFTVNVEDALLEQKNAAIQELNDYYNQFNLSNYTLENISNLLAELKAGEEAIRAATSIDGINIALATAKAKLAAIPQKESSGGTSKVCGGNITATSVILSTVALVGVALLIYKKKKD